jgi:hypothetical protein
VEKKEKKEKKPVAPQSSEPMIVVHVNDRLGTKAAIPCLASDPISKCLLSAASPRKAIGQIYSYYVLYRALQGPSGSPNRSRTPRNHVETPGRTSFQGPVDVGGLWREQRSTT